jgi:hypothetical protein
MSATPRLHVLVSEPPTSPYSGIESALPRLLNVVDLGQGQTGVILAITGEDNAQVSLRLYEDGARLGDLKILDSIGSGE